MTKNNTNIYYKLILLLFIVFILIACNKNPQKPDTSKKEELPKLPNILTELEDGVLEIMYDLDSITGIEKAIEKNSSLEIDKNVIIEATAKPSAENDEDSEEKDSKDREKENNTTNDKKSKQIEEKVDIQEFIVENEIIIPLLKSSDVKGSFEQSSSPPANIDKVWNVINDNVIDIHKKWNVLESQLPLEKVSLDKTEEFEKILNNLTLSIVDRKVLNSLILANELTRVTTNFRSYFDGISNDDVYGMYYNTRGAILYAASNNYSGAINHLNETSKIGDFIRRDLIKKDSENILKKFELSIEDLRNQLTDENFYLSQIKAPIVIKNIKLIQDVFETEK